MLTCQVCTAPLPPKKSAGGTPRKFCGPSCKARAAYYRRSGTARDNARLCVGCNAEFSVTAARTADGKLKRADTRWCHDCRPSNVAPASAMSRRLFYRYGMSLEQYRAALERGCQICGTTTAARFHIDHDHSCCSGQYTCGKCVRGLLCGPCNQAIGLLDENPDRLAAAAAYLLKNHNVIGGAPSRS